MPLQHTMKINDYATTLRCRCDDAAFRLLRHDTINEDAATMMPAVDKIYHY